MPTRTAFASLSILATAWLAAAPSHAQEPPRPRPPRPKPEAPGRPAPELPDAPRPEVPGRREPLLDLPFRITTVTPAALAVRPGRSAACTLEGSSLDEIAELRVTRGGAVEAGWSVEKAAASRSLVSLRIQAPAGAAAGEVKLELRRAGTPARPFQAVAGLALRVERPLAITGVRPGKDAPKLDPKRGGTGLGAAKPANPRAGLVEHLADAPARRVPRSIDLAKQSGIEIQGLRPAQRAALGGAFEITGTGLAKAGAVKLGDRELELVTRDDRRIVGRFPGGVAPLSGTLALVVGGRAIPLVTGYEAVDGFASLQPKLTLRHEPSPLQGPARRADGRIYDRTNCIIAFDVEQLPGTECSMTLASYLDGGEAGSTIASGLAIEFGEAGVNLNGALLASRPRLTVTVRDRALDLRKTFELELPIDLAPRETVVVEETASLRDLWQFEQTWAWGQTTGTSDFGAGPVEVGEVEVGGDLAFRIASGPIGTEAVFRSVLSKLKNGVTVESMEWSESRSAPQGQSPKARALTIARDLADRAVFDVGELAPGNFQPDAGLPEGFGEFIDHTFRSIPVVLRPHGAAASDAFRWTRPLVWMDYDERTEGNRAIYGLESSDWLRSMFVALKADATALNDHRVTVRLDRVTFKVPPGEPLDPLFVHTIVQERERIELIPKLQVR